LRIIFAGPAFHDEHRPGSFFFNQKYCQMSKLKHIKRNSNSHDKEDNRKFMTVLAVSTVLLMVLMYFLFAR